MIRRAAASDLPEMALLEARGMNGGGWSEVQLADQFVQTDGCVLVVVEDDRVVAHAVGRDLAGEAEVLSLVVAPEARRRGLGRALLGALLAELGGTAALLELRASNVPAMGLYAAAGFVVVGRRARYYDDGEDALLMTRATP